MKHFCTVLLLGLAALLPRAVLAGPDPVPPRPPAAGAALFEAARPALAGLRTLVRATGKQFATGSAFLVDGQGRAITNFHVVADAILDPQSYTLEYHAISGATGKARVLAVDAVSDLALVVLEGAQPAHLDLDHWRAAETLNKGDPLHSIGNPLDLGFTVTSGSYSGLLEGNLIGRIHYSGVLNPGMSGGPALDDRGRLVGVNVSKTWEGELVSFLVPIDRARALLARALAGPPLAEDKAREEITRQLATHQQRIVDMAFAQPWKTLAFGPYRAPEFLTEVSDCGSTSNHNPLSPPVVLNQFASCALKETARVQQNLTGGGLRYRHTYLESRALNSLLFSRHVDQELRRGLLNRPSSGRGRTLCRDDFVSAGPSGRLPVRLVWCTQAIRGYPGLYDIEVSAATQDRSDRALVSRLSLNGFSWANGQRLTRRLLETLQ